MRFVVFVRLKGRPGKFPVQWTGKDGGYVVSGKQFHETDNPATSVLESELKAVVSMVVARAALKSFEVIVDE